MLIHPQCVWCAWVRILVLAGIGAALSALVLVPHYQARIVTMQRDQAQGIATARAADVETLKLARRQGDALTLRLQTTESTLSKTHQELQYAIHTQTTGRTCLSSGAVRLLNSAAPTDASAYLPAPTAGPSATDGPVATDTDVATWVANARTQYDICRARLSALIDFTPPDQTP